MTLPQFLPTASVPIALGLGWPSGRGWFPRAPVPLIRLDGYPRVCQSALPAPAPVALVQGSRQQKLVVISLAVFSIVRHDGSVGRRFPSFH